MLRKLKTMLPALAMLKLLSACADGQESPDISFCRWALPIYASPDDVLTPATARQLLHHDETGQNLCGWQEAQ